MAKQSAEIAAALINQKGGILGGRQVQIVVEDDAGQPQTGALAEKRKMVSIAYGATAVRLTERGLKYFFRTCSRDDSQSGDPPRGNRTRTRRSRWRGVATSWSPVSFRTFPRSTAPWMRAPDPGTRALRTPASLRPRARPASGPSRSPAEW